MNMRKFRRRSEPVVWIVRNIKNGWDSSQNVTVLPLPDTWRIYTGTDSESERILYLENPRNCSTIVLTGNSLSQLGQLLTETGYMPASSQPDAGGES